MYVSRHDSGIYQMYIRKTSSIISKVLIMPWLYETKLLYINYNNGVRVNDVQIECD